MFNVSKINDTYGGLSLFIHNWLKTVSMSHLNFVSGARYVMRKLLRCRIVTSRRFIHSFQRPGHIRGEMNSQRHFLLCHRLILVNIYVRFSREKVLSTI